MASVNPKTEQARSEGLLPETPDSDEDERVDVAEEMNLDQQSDQARRVGQAPANGKDSPLKPAIDRAVPPI